MFFRFLVNCGTQCAAFFFGRICLLRLLPLALLGGLEDIRAGGAVSEKNLAR
mgnify:FL=1